MLAFKSSNAKCPTHTMDFLLGIESLGLDFFSISEKFTCFWGGGDFSVTFCILFPYTLSYSFLQILKIICCL